MKKVLEKISKLDIPDELLAKKLLKGCLGLADLQTIQARGIGFFRKHFKVLEKISKLDIPDEILEGIPNEWNPIVYVDRTVRPSYPDFVKEVKYPELELTGPADFDVRKIEQWLHPKQVEGYATGNEIHDELLAKKLLEGCLGLADLQTIQARGIGFFRKHFKESGKAVFAWKSVVLLRNGHLNVPCLFGHGDEVKLYWHWLHGRFNSGLPALRHAS